MIPFGDLLIGAAALSLGFQVLTGNLRDFQHSYRRDVSPNKKKVNVPPVPQVSYAMMCLN